MRILVDCSNYFADNENQGDKAIFRIVARRLRAVDRDVRIQFLTRNPGLIREACEGTVEPVDVGQAHQFFDFGVGQAPQSISALDRFVPGHMRRCLKEGVRARLCLRNDRPIGVESFVEALCDADLAVATGGGYFSDAFPEHAVGVLDTLAGVVSLGKPAVMMGAGFESVTHGALLTKARGVLPRLSLIACREGVSAPRLLAGFGVGAERVRVTGDDAVELAWEHRASRLGDGLGVNLRQAQYSGVDDRQLPVLQALLNEASHRWNVPLLPVPVSLHGPSDFDSIAKLIGPALAGEEAELRTLEGTMRQVGRCRVVVTGSYHAAVFALSQGVPVLGLARSLHYRAKLGGVAAQFGGEGCIVLALDDPGFPGKATAALESLWERAERLRPALLQFAERQIEAGRAAYGLLGNLV